MSSRVIPGRDQELVWDVRSGLTEQEWVQRVQKPLRNWEEYKSEQTSVVENHRHRGSRTPQRAPAEVQLGFNLSLQKPGT